MLINSSVIYSGIIHKNMLLLNLNLFIVTKKTKGKKIKHKLAKSIDGSNIRKNYLRNK